MKRLDVFAVSFCEEAVDWNYGHVPGGLWEWRSASAKRLWIEITTTQWKFTPRWVSFCEEAVDWNSQAVPVRHPGHRQLLRRGCGLKFPHLLSHSHAHGVSFCEEAVDWNIVLYINQYFLTNVSFCEEAVDWNCISHEFLPLWFSQLLRRGCGLK